MWYSGSIGQACVAPGGEVSLGPLVGAVPLGGGLPPDPHIVNFSPQSLAATVKRKCFVFSY